MKRLPIVVAFCAAAFVPAVVNAHGGEAGILVFPAEAPIGATVTVFGEDLAPDTTLELYVLTAVGEVLIGEPMTDEIGHFSFEWTLPADLAPRVYELRLAM